MLLVGWLCLLPVFTVSYIPEFSAVAGSSLWAEENISDGEGKKKGSAETEALSDSHGLPSKPDDYLEDPSFLYEIYFHHYPRLRDSGAVDRALRNKLESDPAFKKRLNERLERFLLTSSFFSRRWQDAKSLALGFHQEFLRKFGHSRWRHQLFLDSFKTADSFLTAAETQTVRNETPLTLAQIHESAVAYATKRFRLSFDNNNAYRSPPSSEVSESGGPEDHESENKGSYVDIFSAFKEDPDFRRLYQEGRLAAETKTWPNDNRAHEDFKQSKEFLLAEIADLRRTIWSNLFQFITSYRPESDSKPLTFLGRYFEFGGDHFSLEGDYQLTLENLSHFLADLAVATPTAGDIERVHQGDILSSKARSQRGDEYDFSLFQSGAESSGSVQPAVYATRYLYPRDFIALSYLEVPRSVHTANKMRIPLDALGRFFWGYLDGLLTHLKGAQRSKVFQILMDLERDRTLAALTWALKHPASQNLRAYQTIAQLQLDRDHWNQVKRTAEPKLEKALLALDDKSVRKDFTFPGWRRPLEPYHFWSDGSIYPSSLMPLAHSSRHSSSTRAAYHLGRLELNHEDYGSLLPLAWLTELREINSKDSIDLTPTMNLPLRFEDIVHRYTQGGDLVEDAELRGQRNVYEDARWMVHRRNASDFARLVGSTLSKWERHFLGFLVMNSRISAIVENLGRPKSLEPTVSGRSLVDVSDPFESYWYTSGIQRPTIFDRLRHMGLIATVYVASLVAIFSMGALVWGFAQWFSHFGSLGSHLGSLLLSLGLLSQPGSSSVVEMPSVGAARNDPASGRTSAPSDEERAPFRVRSSGNSVPDYYNILTLEDLRDKTLTFVDQPLRPLDPHEPFLELEGRVHSDRAGIALPIPDHYQVRELSLKQGGQSQKVSILKNSAGRMVAQMEGRPRGTYEFLVRATPPSFSQSSSQWLLSDRSKLKDLMNDLREVGFTRIADELERHLQDSPSISLQEMAELFSEASLYSHQWPGRETFSWKRNSFFRFQSYVKEGALCGECDGSNALLVEFLKRYYQDQPPISVQPLISYARSLEVKTDAEGFEPIPHSPLHQRSLVFNKDTGSYVILDATAKTKDTYDEASLSAMTDLEGRWTKILNSLSQFTKTHPQWVEFTLSMIALYGLSKSRRALRSHMESLRWPDLVQGKKARRDTDASLNNRLSSATIQERTGDERSRLQNERSEHLASDAAASSIASSIEELNLEIEKLEKEEKLLRVSLATAIRDIRDRLISEIQVSRSNKQASGGSEVRKDPLILEMMTTFGAMAQALEGTEYSVGFIKTKLGVDGSATPDNLREALLGRLNILQNLVEHMERYDIATKTAMFVNPIGAFKMGQPTSDKNRTSASVAVVGRKALQGISDAYQNNLWHRLKGCTDRLKALKLRD